MGSVSHSFFEGLARRYSYHYSHKRKIPPFSSFASEKKMVSSPAPFRTPVPFLPSARRSTANPDQAALSAIAVSSVLSSPFPPSTSPFPVAAYTLTNSPPRHRRASSCTPTVPLAVTPASLASFTDARTHPLSSFSPHSPDEAATKDHTDDFRAEEDNQKKTGRKRKALDASVWKEGRRILKRLRKSLEEPVELEEESEV